MFSSSNRHNAAEPSYADVWEDTETESCGSPLPRVMSFSRRPTSEFNRPKRGISAIARLVAAERKQFNPNSKPSLLTALLKPSTIVQPLVSPTTTKDPIIFPTNKPGTTRISRGLESLRSFQDLGTSTASNAPIPAEIQVAEAPSASSTNTREEHDLSPPSPPASLIAEPFDPQEYQYDKRYRPSIPCHQHQWHPIRESQPVYYAFPAYCPREPPSQESPFLAPSLSNSSSPQKECTHTRSDSAIAGIPLGAHHPEAEASTGAITIAGTATATLPPPILRSPTSPTSLLISWTANVDAYPDPPDPDPDQINPSSPASPSAKTAAAPASPSYCTRCVIPFTFDISYLDQDESWECCNCAAKNIKMWIGEQDGIVRVVLGRNLILTEWLVGVEEEEEGADGKGKGAMERVYWY
ncbi:hypothetical protein B0H65DRAFT_584921 [Neurospora tetraspora]|uniref:Uncharacterized protein n=1 Tax=Neurospora tetraspora TaxID=94610 RepID=A0AAE0MWQ8_9PEZI|nr:hypothetical protein B0H65DRAFT_584921 [Neurospora tetraspora]